jgi:hypothetical protein
MNKFIGAWQLQSWVAKRGYEVIYPFGEHPTGHISYAANNTMIVAIMHDVKNIHDFFITENPLEATDLECILGFRSYLSYWGTFSVDEDAKIVIHKIEGCLHQNWIGTEQKRSFEFKDDLLLLSTELNQFMHTLTWRRI